MKVSVCFVMVSSLSVNERFCFVIGKGAAIDLLDVPFLVV